MRFSLLFFMSILAIFLESTQIYSQVFTRITDLTNPIVTDPDSTNYYGCSWIDVDNDDDLDLFVNNRYLYINDGFGKFTKATGTGLGDELPNSLGNGNSWADYDNDGDLDVFLAGNRLSFLYRNDGGHFTKITGSGFLADNNGFATAWGDYDNDGYVDLVIASPFGFGPTHSNRLYHNNGNGTFQSIDTSIVATGLAAYTVPSWYDYDQDGDIDLFIGSGPITASGGPDFFYRNMLKETGTAFFSRITEGNFATDFRDGQNVNWIDYDNDQDLDMYVTNYGSAGGLALRQNNLYRNDGNNTFTKITNQPLTQDAEISLGNLWADFDNDGDEDCFVTNEAAVNNPSRYYRNDGNGNFTRIDGILLPNAIPGDNGATAGDYDNDGDLDLFIFAFPSGLRRFYRNDQPVGNHWLRLHLNGTVSNYASIGARVKAKATIGGNSVWQYRELSAQNTFNGHNALEIHLGFGDATMVDSIQIIWPSGTTKTLTQVPTNQYLVLTENVSATAAPVFLKIPLKSTFATQLFTTTIRAGAIPVASYHLIDPIGDAVIDSSTGVMTWTPQSSDVGNHSFAIAAFNEAGNDTVELNVTVLEFSKPVVNVKSDITLFAGTVYHDVIQASGNPVVKYFIISAPNGFAVDSNSGALQWTPASGGTVSVELLAKNLAGLDTLSYSIHVDSKPTLAVLQNPALPKFADLILNCENTLTGNPTLKIGNVSQGNMTSVPGTDKIFKFGLEFTQTADYAISVDAVSISGHKVVLNKTFSAVLVKPTTITELKHDQWSVVFNQHTFAEEAVVLIEPDSVNGDLIITFSGQQELKNAFQLNFKEASLVYSLKTNERINGISENGTMSVNLPEYGLYRIQKVKGKNFETRTLPKGVVLLGNYPNPFNPATAIQYSLDQEAKIDLAIYNTLGQRVKTLFTGNHPAGFHSQTWDGTNDRNFSVTSGIYLVRLKSPNSVTTRKILLMK
ncbi:FG-GAP-like repeat-containing protein [bacterium]|nr:FG-GAP-like repeat-containing protein [bacterium]